MMTATGFDGVLFGKVAITAQTFAAYPPEMKTQAALLILETGMIASQAAKSLGISRPAFLEIASQFHWVGPVGGRDRTSSDEDLSLDDAGLLILEQISWQPNHQMFATVTEFARRTSLSEYVCKRAMTLLEAKGYLRQGRKLARGKPTMWQVTPQGLRYISTAVAAEDVA